jgi:hypothetical protein
VWSSLVKLSESNEVLTECFLCLCFIERPLLSIFTPLMMLLSTPLPRHKLSKADVVFAVKLPNVDFDG